MTRATSPHRAWTACLPDPAHLGDRMFGKTCAGTWVKGVRDGRLREVYLYQVADNETCMARYGVQAVVWQTAVNPVIALELLDAGIWRGAGMLGPEAFDPDPFMERMEAYGFPCGIRESAQDRSGLVRLPSHLGGTAHRAGRGRRPPAGRPVPGAQANPA